MKISARWLSSLGCLLVLSACSDERISIGEICTRISGPTCDRAVACGIGPASERRDCVESFIAGCCREDGSCGERAPSDAQDAAAEAFIAQCSSALRTWDCEAFRQGDVPPVCDGGSAASALTFAAQSRALATPLVQDRRFDQVRRLGRQSGARLAF